MKNKLFAAHDKLAAKYFEAQQELGEAPEGMTRKETVLLERAKTKVYIARERLMAERIRLEKESA